MLSHRPTAGSRKLGATLSPRHLSSQRQYQGQDSLIAALEEKYVLSGAEETLHDSSSSESLQAQALPQQPIHMLGSLVSPHLVQAKASLPLSKPRLMQVPQLHGCPVCHIRRDPYISTAWHRRPSTCWAACCLHTWCRAWLPLQQHPRAAQS